MYNKRDVKPLVYQLFANIYLLVAFDYINILRNLNVNRGELPAGSVVMHNKVVYAYKPVKRHNRILNSLGKLF